MNLSRYPVPSVHTGSPRKHNTLFTPYLGSYQMLELDFLSLLIKSPQVVFQVTYLFNLLYIFKLYFMYRCSDPLPNRIAGIHVQIVQLDCTAETDWNYLESPLF